MKCSNCGHENASYANYCAVCNYKIDSTPVTTDSSTQSSALETNDAPTTSAIVDKPAETTEPAITATPAPTASPTATSVPTYTAPTQTSSPTYGASPYSSAPTYSSASVRPGGYPYQQPYYYSPVAQRTKQPFSITDAYIIIGFVLAVVGIFSYAFILLPASILFSVVGFVKRTNARTLGLSIAGIVVGVVACLIKIGMVLNDLGFIPDWLSAGIF